MPRVETIVPPEPIESEQPVVHAALIRLRADQIQIDPVIAKARSGPVPANERIKIESLALSIRTLGQLVPCIVEPIEPSQDNPVDNNSRYHQKYRLVDGWRRVQAATHINQTVDPGFELLCIVRESDTDPLRAALHANLKRRGLSPLQFAYLCSDLRTMHGWKGTRELAQYLQVSRATISQHDKLLAKPEGMEDSTYRDLLDKVANGSMGAEAAFELLTHVDPTQAGRVLENAGEKAAHEAIPDTAEPSTTANGSTASPRASGARQSASGTNTKTKTKPITRAHIRQAAQETGAVVQPTSKGIPELRKLFDQMRASTYPDVMRSFVSLVAEEWWRGDCKDKDVLAQWGHIADIVTKSEASRRKRRL